MDLKFFFFIFSTIICSDGSNYVFKKIDNDNNLNLKISESEKEIIVSISSKDYFVFDGDWYDGEICFLSNQFEIHGYRMYEWLKQNVISDDYLRLFFNTLDDRIFALNTEKKVFYERKINNNFECKFKLFKKEDVSSIMTEYLEKIQYFDPSDDHAKDQVFNDALVKLQPLGDTYSIKFNNNNGETIIFFDYVLGVYEQQKVVNPEGKNDHNKKIDLFKKTVVKVAKHTFVSVAIFGPYGLLLAYLIGKYLIKK